MRKADKLGIDTPSIRASALSPLLLHFQGRSDQLADLLVAHGLTLHTVRDPYAVVPLTAFLAVLEDAAATTTEPFLGARLGLAMTPADLGPAGILLSQSATIRRGLVRFTKSLSALQGATVMTFQPGDALAQLSYQFTTKTVAHHPQDTEFSISCMCQIVRLAFSLKWRPVEVHVQHARSSNASQLESILGAPVLFGQPVNRIVIDQEGLDVHYRDEDDALIALIERHVAELAQENRLDLVDRVGLIVGRRLGLGDVTVASVARELGIAPRTLQRRLGARGTSLRMIVREQRMRSATAQLRGQAGGQISEIAHSMGYSDATAFGRAYRSWFGQTPTGRP